MLDIEGLSLRAALFRSIRSFFERRGFLEVDTPIRYPILLPEQHIVPVSSDGWFLQPSPEQCMKRLLARGCSALFQVCHCFRSGERGRHHLPEFTMLEWYRKGADYRDVMGDCQDLVCHVLEGLRERLPVTAPGLGPSWLAAALSPPWQCLTVEDAFTRFCPESAAEALAADRFDELLVEFIEPRLGTDGPVFLLDYPASCASLAQLKTDNSAVAERFELYINGIELANGFTELTDAVEQRSRFRKELEASGVPTERVDGMLPVRFLEELNEVGPAAGIAFGIDRLLMLLLGADTIDGAVSFTPESLL